MRRKLKIEVRGENITKKIDWYLFDFSFSEN